MDPKLIAPLITTAVVVLAVYRHLHRSFGPQKISVTRLWIRIGIVAALSQLCGASITTAADFEAPPDQSATAFLPCNLVAGRNFSIVDPVHDDGLMHRYVIDSR
jgi:hypothetical protein